MKIVKDGNIYKAIKEVERKYWKREETEQPWTQPVLSANGTIGGDSFACAANTEYTVDSPAWRAFDNDAVTGWEGLASHGLPNILEWYNPSGLKITQITFTSGVRKNSSIVVCVKDYTIQASEDGNIWVDIYTGTNTSYSEKKSITVNISNNNFYKYWRISVNSVNSGTFVRMWSVSITATQLEETITPGTAEDYDFYTDENVYKCWGQAPTTIFESSTAGSYTVNLESGNYEITCVGGGGAAAMRGVYDDRGYGWSGGSGAVYKGVFTLPAGNYAIVVGSANNNTLPQGGNTNTLNPPDATTHDSYVQGVVTCGGGGCGHYNPNYVGAAGAAPVLTLTPVSTALNSQGNVGNYNSGGKGSSAGPVINGGASVYQSYGQGQGCRPSEYANGRQWFDGTNGYIRIRRMYQ